MSRAGKAAATLLMAALSLGAGAKEAPAPEPQAQRTACINSLGIFPDQVAADACGELIALKNFSAISETDLHLLRALHLGRAGKTDAALADFDAAAKTAPKNPTVLGMRGEFKINGRDYVGGLADLDQALALAPGDPELLSRRCVARAIWGKELDKAVADCDASLIAGPTPVTLARRGLAHLRAADFAAALDDYDAAYRADGDIVTALYGRGLAKKKLGRGPEGDADLAAATARNADVAADFAAMGLKP